MFFRLKEIQNYRLQASDGDFGEIKGFIIDDLEWAVRYMIVSVGSRNVLLSRYALGQPDPAAQVFHVNVSREKVMNSPALDPELKLSREMERRLSDYFDWPYYWDADDVPTTHPGDLTAVPLIEMELEREESEREMVPQTGQEGQSPHLRNTQEIFGYAVYATNSDSHAGQLNDMVINGDDWSILYLIVDTGGVFSSGSKVLVSPQWVKDIDELSSQIYLDLKEETVRSSPSFQTIEDLTEEYLNQVRRHYDQ